MAAATPAPARSLYRMNVPVGPDAKQPRGLGDTMIPPRAERRGVGGGDYAPDPDEFARPAPREPVRLASRRRAYRAIRQHFQQQAEDIISQMKGRSFGQYTLGSGAQLSADEKLAMFLALHKCLFRELGYTYSNEQRKWAIACLDALMITFFGPDYIILAARVRRIFNWPKRRANGRVFILASRRAGKSWIIAAIFAAVLATVYMPPEYLIVVLSPSKRQSDGILNKVLSNLQRIPWLDQKRIRYSKTEGKIAYLDPITPSRSRVLWGLPSGRAIRILLGVLCARVCVLCALAGHLFSSTNIISSSPPPVRAVAARLLAAVTNTFYIPVVHPAWGAAPTGS